MSLIATASPWNSSDSTKKRIPTMRKTMKNKSLCKGARVEKPNKCKKLKGCKVAKGTRRVFCRKTKNKSMKNKSMKNKSMKNKK